MIGVSLPVSLLLGKPATSAQQSVLTHFGSAPKMLEALRNEGVSSIEIRDAHAPVSVEDQTAAVLIVKDAGMKSSLHILFDDSDPEEYRTRMRPVFDAALSGQSRLNLTVHLWKGAAETERLLRTWRFGDRITVSLENMRVKKPENTFMFLESVDEIVTRTHADGITWDMGHYAYNREKKGQSPDLLPDVKILKKVIHTHIHAFSYGNTHFPLLPDNNTVHSYVRALREAGYSGIWNLELEPERYEERFDPSEGYLTSIRTLKQFLE